MSITRNTAYNLAGGLLPLAITIVTLPRYIGVIGEARYGVLVVLWTLLGYFGLFDLGTGRAVTNKIAALCGAPATDREQVFWTALGLNGALGIVGALLFWSVGYVILTRYVHVPSALAIEVQRALPWMALAFPLLLMSGVCSGALQGREEFLVQNVISVVGGAFVQLAPLAVAIWLGPSLPQLVIAVMAVRITSMLGLFAACRMRVPARSRPQFAPALVAPLFSYGGWIAVSSAVAPLLTTLDRVIIGVVVGAQAVTYYAVPFSLATRVTILPGALSGALFPRFSGQTDAEAERLLFRSTRLLVVLMLAPIAIGLWLMEPFLTWWMGEGFSNHAALAGQWIVLGLWLNVSAYPAYSSIPARGRPDLIAKLQMAEAVPYIALLWLALTQYGVAGGAAVWAFRNTVDATLLIWMARTDRRIWRLVLQSFGFLCLSVVIARWARPRSVAWWADTAGLLFLMAVWAWRIFPRSFVGSWQRMGVWTLSRMTHR